MEKMQELNDAARKRCERLQELLATETISVEDAARLLNMRPMSLRGRIARGTIGSVRTSENSVMVPKVEIRRLRTMYMPRAQDMAS
jgi:hypothetical protein